MYELRWFCPICREKSDIKCETHKCVSHSFTCSRCACKAVIHIEMEEFGKEFRHPIYENVSVKCLECGSLNLTEKETVDQNKKYYRCSECGCYFLINIECYS